MNLNDSAMCHTMALKQVANCPSSGSFSQFRITLEILRITFSSAVALMFLTLLAISILPMTSITHYYTVFITINLRGYRVSSGGGGGGKLD